jgi:hypothetical protein
MSPQPNLVAVADPAPQPRFGVVFRLLLAIPHAIVLGILGFVATVVAFIGWWGALFTGQLPEFAVTFLSGFLRWSSRVNAYEFMLTDAYPPFTFDDDPAYPVRIAIPEPQRLNRAAVFFRYFLAIPAGILGLIVEVGAGTLMAFIAWLVTLFAGRMPGSIHLAYVAVLRFRTRYTGYWHMLTPAYPGGLYGDGPGAVAWADGVPEAQAPGFGTQAPGFGTPGPAYETQGPAWGNPVDSSLQGYYGAPSGYDPTYDPTAGHGASGGYGAPVGYGAPGTGYGTPAGFGAPGTGYGAPGTGYGTPVGYGAQAGYSLRPLFQPATWLLPLTSAARKLVTTFIVLGSLLVVAYIALYVTLIGSTVGAIGGDIPAAIAISQLNSSYATLTNSLTTLEQAATSCDQNLTCLTKNDSKAASAFNTFSSQLSDTSVPSGAASAKARLAADSAAAAKDYTQLSQTTSDAQYQSTFTSTGLQQKMNTFDSDYTALTNNLQTNLVS